MWVDTFLIIVLLSDLYILATSRLLAFVKVFALQGIILALLPLMIHSHTSIHTWIACMGIFLIKGVLIPYFITQAIHKVKIRREIEPFIGFTTSLLIGMVIVMFSFWLGDRFQEKSPLQNLPDLLVPASIATVLIGLFVLLSRRKAVSQVLGYLVMENGIVILGLSLLDRMPVLVEMGALLDVFAAVFVMAIIMYRIDQEFDHINVDQLARLKG